MKKVYLLVLTAITTGMAFGQINKNPLVQSNFSSSPVKTATKHVPAKAAGITVWSDDFSDASTWTLDNQGQTPPQYGWSIDASVDGWYFNNAVASPSGGAFAELNNGNPVDGTQELDVIYTMTTAEAIDISSVGTNLTLEFYQYGARFNDLQEWQVSTDGGVSFQSISDNSDKEALSQSGGSAYDNPELVRNTLNHLIQGADSLMFRFRWTTAFPGQAGNANVWITYGWMIDDVALVTSADNDVAVVEEYTGTDGVFYTQIPDEQIAPIDFEVALFNAGLNEAKNATLSIDVNGGAFTSTGAGIDILAADTGVVTAGPYTPAGIGTYTVTRTVQTDSIEDVPSDNELADLSFEVGDFIYARDLDAPEGEFSRDFPYELGNLFEVFTPQQLRGIDAQIAAKTGVSDVYVRLYYIDTTVTPASFEYITESAPVPAASITNNTMTTFTLVDFINLEVGTSYIAVVGSFEEGLEIANSGISPDQTSFLYNHTDGEWFFLNNTPMVRMNFDPTLGTEELSETVSAVSLYPVPSTDAVTLSYELKTAADVNVIVTDAAGRVVFNTTYANEAATKQVHEINIADFANGIYTVTIQSNDGMITKKIVKK